jgi:hypothetical protein
MNSPSSEEDRPEALPNAPDVAGVEGHHLDVLGGFDSEYETLRATFLPILPTNDHWINILTPLLVCLM